MTGVQGAAGVEVRSNHRWAYRSGEWGLVRREVLVRGNPCWLIVWPDGATDTWPVTDPNANYEFRRPYAVGPT